jgi:hypothetical protein
VAKGAPGDDVKRFPEFRGPIKRRIFEVTSDCP